MEIRDEPIKLHSCEKVMLTKGHLNLYFLYHKLTTKFYRVKNVHASTELTVSDRVAHLFLAASFWPKLQQTFNNLQADIRNLSVKSFIRLTQTTILNYSKTSFYILTTGTGSQS